ncbi:unnamed protein product, partial [Adineta steineri]
EYTPEEKDTRRLTIERFIFRAPHEYKKGRKKYLYRPRFVQYLSIHNQIIGLSKEESSKYHITLAHYISMNYPRLMSGCNINEIVQDTNIRNRFAKRIKAAIAVLMS